MDIVVHPDRLDAYKTYLAIYKETEKYLEKNEYLKADLPVLSPALIPESYLEVFSSDYIYQSERTPLFLTPSPELFLKRLIAYSGGDWYYLGKAFRNSERSSDRHSFEFTMLEFYKTKATYFDIADEVLGLMRHLAISLTGTDVITYGAYKVTFDKWEKLSVAEAFNSYAGIDERDLFNRESLVEKAKSKGYVVDGFSYEDIFSQIYVQEIEPQLGIHGKPTLLYDYPKEFAALAKLNEDGKTAERFEFYIGGVELGDCYTELTDWEEQEIRFTQEQQKRKELGLSIHSVDKGFIQALQYGLTPCAGIAIGFERLAMVFANKTSIQDLKIITIK